MNRIKRLSLIALFVALLLLLSPRSGNAALVATADFTAVDTYVQKYMDENRVPGLSLVIVEGDQITHTRGFGVADSSGRFVTAQTPFIIGSNGKSFTALAVMQLVEAGKLDLGDKVVQYLPWFRVGDPEMSAQISIRHLLNHTSGMSTRMGDETQAVDDSRPEALEQAVRAFSAYSLSHAPGMVYEYSNANYQTAGLLVQTVSGETYEDYIQKHIFDPLEMRNSSASIKTAQANGLAQGYRYWFGFPLPIDNMPFPRHLVPAGYLTSSAEDMGHWLILHMNKGHYQDKMLVSLHGMDELHRPYLGDYAMGWVALPGLLMHNGSVPTYGSQMFIDTRANRGIATLFNVNHSIDGDRLYMLAPNVNDILNGKAPALNPTTSANYIIYMGQVVLLLLVDIVWFVWSFRKCLRWWKMPARRPHGMRLVLYLVLPLVLEIGVCILLLLSVLSHATIGNVLLFSPDFGLLMFSLLALALGWGLIRTIWEIWMSMGHAENLLQVKSPYWNAEG